MGRMSENPRCHVRSVRLSDEEKVAVDGLTVEEVRQALVQAGTEKKTGQHKALEVLQAEEFDDAEIITWAVSIGMTQLMILRKKLPEHARNARKIKAIEDAIYNLAAGHGKPLSDEMVDYVIGCWNRTMQKIQRGLEPMGAGIGRLRRRHLQLPSGYKPFRYAPKGVGKGSQRRTAHLPFTERGDTPRYRSVDQPRRHCMGSIWGHRYEWSHCP